MPGRNSHTLVQLSKMPAKCNVPPPNPQLQMEQTFTPAVTLQLMVEQNPSWAFWSTQFIPIANQLMARVSDAPMCMHASKHAVHACSMLCDGLSTRCLHRPHKRRPAYSCTQLGPTHR